MPSLSVYLLATQTYPGIMWEGTTQVYEYREAAIAEDHLRVGYQTRGNQS